MQVYVVIEEFETLVEEVRVFLDKAEAEEFFDRRRDECREDPDTAHYLFGGQAPGKLKPQVGLN